MTSDRQISPLRGLLLALPFCAAMIIGCGRKQPPSTPDISREGSKSGEVAQTTPAPSRPAKVETLTFDKATLPQEYTHIGRAIGGARWSDANGENTLIISRRESPHGEERRDEIFGYLYVAGPDSIHLLWKIQDLADNYCDVGKGLVSNVEVTDIDGDGIAENAFVYNVQGTCDVSPKPFKLIMHSGAKKLAIRGTNTVNPSDGPIGGEKSFDPAFDGAPDGFRAFASKLWDESIKRQYEGP